MNNCIFCKIINKEIPGEIVFEDDKVIAFLDAYPESKGHTLLVPKQHYANIMEKEDEIDLFAYLKKVVKLLKEDYKFEDFKVVNNCGKKAGQEVFHMHIHIIPYY
ncbi:MAG: HIT family protein [Mycoplasmatales bacterium]